MSKWGGDRASSVEFANYQKAFEEMERHAQAALHGLWFEYDGYFSQVSSEYCFSLIAHCHDPIRTFPESKLACPPVPNALVAEGEAIYDRETNFRNNYDRARYATWMLQPNNPALKIDVRSCQYYGDMTRPIFLTPAHFNGVDAVTQYNWMAYCNQFFLRPVTPAETWTLRHKFLNSDAYPVPDIDGYVRILGYIIWTHGGHTESAQEFVEGFYNVTTRQLLLSGFARSLLSIETNLGMDAYILTVSEDGHSFEGNAIF
jgi:hypothetical protein